MEKNIKEGIIKVEVLDVKEVVEMQKTVEKELRVVEGNKKNSLYPEGKIRHY